MSQVYSVAVVVGSLRKDSYNRKVARALSELAPSSLALRIVEIGDLPLYNEDVEADAPPEAWKRFRDEIRRSDAVLFVTPEYNRSVPGCLKNAIDVGSRPYGQSAWGGKPTAVVSVSPGAIGGFGANHAVRSRWCFWICRACRCPRPISAAQRACSMTQASSTTRPGRSCRRLSTSLLRGLS